MCPELTIVIPVRNREHLIAHTLDTIASSTMLPQRIVVVDNGSTDQSMAVCRQWAAHCTRMNVAVLTEPQPGASIARNRGLADVETPWVYFFDSDDDFDVHFIECFHHWLHSATSETCDLLTVPVSQEVNGHRVERAFPAPATAPRHIVSSMLSTQSMVFRTSWLRRLGGWNTTLLQWDDWELGLRALMASPRLSHLDHPPFHTIHVHAESLTGASFSENYEGTLRAMMAASALGHDAQREDVLQALYLRAEMMAGKLVSERCQAGARRYIDFAQTLPAHHSWPWRMLGRMLRTYSAHHGRGAWRIALLPFSPRH